MSEATVGVGFVPGFSGAAGGVAAALQAAFAPRLGFAAESIRARPLSAFDQAGSGPRHFAPADPEANPTEGWDPFDATPPAADQPFVDPIAAAHDAGYAEGLAAARAELTAEAARDRALTEGLKAAIADDARVDREAIARALRQAVLLLVKRLVGESGVSSELLTQRVDAAAVMLADAAESAVLRLNPADLPLLDGQLPATIFPIGDESIARGSFVLEAASTIVEDGPDLWLDQLAAAIERVGLPIA